MIAVAHPRGWQDRNDAASAAYYTPLGVEIPAATGRGAGKENNETNNHNDGNKYDGWI